MEIIDIPTEQTTAVTDLILAFVSAYVMYALWGFTKKESLKAWIWISAFACMGLAGLLGSVAHGFQMSATANRLWWMPLNLSLGLAVSLFAVGVIHDLLGSTQARRILPILVALGIVFFLVTVLVPGSFLLFIAYDALALLFALGAYTYLAIKRKFPGALFMAAGILTSIIAAAIQATVAVSFVLVWEFDHNGVFHLVQVLGLLLLLFGLKRGFTAQLAEPGI